MKQNTLIIAEAGVNYNGDVELAKKMVQVAKECGADIIKFQTGKPENVMSRFAQKAEYQKATTKAEESQLDMVKKLMLPFADFITLREECNNVGITFLSTPFDLESIRFLKGMGMDVWKIPSGELTNLPYLECVGSFADKVILSTGMSRVEEIHAAVDVLLGQGTRKEDITLLHCTTEYPAPFEEVNLMAMDTLRREFHIPVGYSDHTTGIEVPIAAVAMGATVIEKHFTLDKNMEGPDHKASLEPKELKEMVFAIRNIEKAMGNGIKLPTASELKNRAIARKSIVAKCDIGAGEVLTEENITTKRPGNGVSPMLWHQVLGTSAVRNFREDELIEL